MRVLIVAAVVGLMSTPLMAQDIFVGDNSDADVSTNQSGTLSTNIGTQTDSGNTTVTHESGSGTTTVTNNSTSYKPNGYVSNPALTTSGSDTCFGSQSTGISGAGFGISGGKTVVDENCVMMKQSKLLASLGLKDAAVLLLMQEDSGIAEAVFGAYPELAEQLTSVK